ncbi:MAG: CRISPR-associated helicase Cas3' [Akkermansiaceae bacterium]|nr:CRISPR-associated helicase Cas3' [Akkermansiaceae bacterium]
MKTPNLEDCWAKTDSGDLLALTVQDHCINVGAVGAIIFENLPYRLGKLLPNALPLLAALHDIGKISVGFQWKSAEWPYFRTDLPEKAEGNHAAISHAFLGEIINLREPARWAIALGGHHGRYTSNKPRIRGLEEPYQEWAIKLRKELTELLSGLFGDLPGLEIKIPDHLIHLATGFITFSDWIGSNEDFFPLAKPARLRHETNLTKATSQAKNALHQLLWGKPTPSPKQDFNQLFPFPANALQTALLNTADAPGLYIIEATMGMGKTEAALALAARRWNTGDEQGIYFALPTQLTSNRIHQRISPFLKNAIQSNHANALVHGSAWLNEGRISPINASGDPNEATSWFASSRRALLAPFGVGTIDQALLAILPVKHSALRLFALAGKTIVLDEVHSYDPYTFALICRVVEILTNSGSTVIILSATLTHHSRRRLIEAAGGKEKSPQAAYPLISAVKTNSDKKLTCYTDLSEHAPVEKTIYLEHLSSLANDVESRAIKAAEAGACVLIIRNTVQSAQQTFSSLKSSSKEGLKIGLLHSRFPFFARQDLEDHWVQSLSKESQNRPQGCILVSTQIVEQSIDIDADLLITDLAPADLLLQRIGRLHRHENTPRPSQFQKALALIIHPQLKEKKDPGQLKKELGKSAFIYPPDCLLQAHHDWKRSNSISLPSQIRELLEQENGEGRKVNPAETALREITAAEMAKQIGTAKTRSHDLLNPDAQRDDDEGHQTRWKSLPSSVIIHLSQMPELTGRHLTLHFLSGETHTTLRDQPFDLTLAKLLHANSTKVPAYALPRASFDESILETYFFEHAVCAVLEEGDGGRCHFPGATTELPYLFNYTSEAGLSLHKNEEVETIYEPEDDGSWF